MPKKRRSKRLAMKARKKAKVKSAKKRARTLRRRADRVSIGSALGVTPTKDRETNLVEDRAMASALAAAKRLNSARKTGNPPYVPSRRSSIVMM